MAEREAELRETLGLPRVAQPDPPSVPFRPTHLRGTHHENRRDPAPLPRLLRHPRPRGGAVRTAALQRPDPAVRQRRHGAVQAVLHRGRAGAVRPRHQRAEVRPHPRHRGGRQDHPARHVLPDERQLLLRRLLQGRGDQLRLGAGHRLPGGGRPRLRPGQGLGHRAALRRRGRRAVAQHRRAARRSGSSAADCWTTTGTWASPARAVRAARSTSTAAPQYGPDGGPIVDEDRFLEIWNLVFMQEELSAVRAKDDFDVVRAAAAKNIDTGMGLERVAYLLQGVDNLYEIDEVFPVHRAGGRAGGQALRRRPRRRRPAAGGRRPRPLRR